MNSKRHGYGVHYLTRQIAQRIQREWEAVENPPRPAHWGNVIPFPQVSAPWPPAEGRLGSARYDRGDGATAGEAASA